MRRAPAKARSLYRSVLDIRGQRPMSTVPVPGLQPATYILLVRTVYTTAALPVSG